MRREGGEGGKLLSFQVLSFSLFLLHVSFHLLLCIPSLCLFFSERCPFSSYCSALFSFSSSPFQCFFFHYFLWRTHSLTFYFPLIFTFIFFYHSFFTILIPFFLKGILILFFFFFVLSLLPPYFFSYSSFFLFCFYYSLFPYLILTFYS